MANPRKAQSPADIPIYTVRYEGQDIVVDDQIEVPEVPDDAQLMMESGVLRMYAALPIKSLPIDMGFPVYVESDEMASLVPVESALRRANWTIPDDSVLNDPGFVNELKKTQA